jgi:hypothetical protein
VRVLVLTAAFQRERRLYVRRGSLEDIAMRRVLQQLADDDRRIPGPHDVQWLRTPFHLIWARPVRDTELVINFVVRADRVEVTGVRPAFREIR